MTNLNIETRPTFCCRKSISSIQVKTKKDEEESIFFNLDHLIKAEDKFRFHQLKLQLGNEILRKYLQKKDVDVKSMFLCYLQQDYMWYSNYCKNIADKLDRFQKSRTATEYLMIFQDIYIEIELFEREAKRLRNISL